MATIEDKQQRGARNQALFRDVNERIDSLTGADAVPRSDAWAFLCECADSGCTDTILLTHDEYEAIRQVPTRFPVKPGHVVPEIERVVEEHDGYSVVEKVGEAGAVAAALDPRSH